VTNHVEAAKNLLETKNGGSVMSRLVAFLLGLVMMGVAFHIEALAEAYRVRPGDTLDVVVYQDQKLNRQVVVAPDGRISMPLAGHLRAGGLTLEAIEDNLKGRLKSQFTGDVDITISLVSSKEKPPAPPPPPPPPPIDPSVYVTGEVAKPGQYFFKTRTNVLQAIALAGGLGPFAAERRIKVRRNEGGSEVLYEFDYDAFTSGEDLSGNMMLRSGDVIIVPEKGLFE
jgi:polysaccharide biosynthesis/export protein